MPVPSNSNLNSKASHPNPGPSPTQAQAAANISARPDGPSNRVDLINSEAGRILCIADVRGRISLINELAKEFKAVAVIHSGDFGFYEPSSLDRISDRTLRHLIQYSSLITPQFRSQLLAPGLNVHSIRQIILSPPQASSTDSSGPNLNSSSDFALSEFPDLLTGKLKLDVPVYTVWGACEDVAILEKIRASGPSVLCIPPQSNNFSPESIKSNVLSVYSIPNLTVLDEATTRCLVIGGVRLRLFGLGGSVVLHKLFDNGEGGATISGGQGTMWTSVLQVGEVVDTAQRVYDPSETRLLVSHASPGREGLLAQLALVLKADLTISAGLHFRYGISYNDFSVQHEQEAFRAKLHHAKSAFNEIWDTVKSQVEAVIDDHQRQLLYNALAVANRVPAATSSGGGAASEEPAWKNSWNWNLPDAAYGNLILDIKDGRIGAEMRSQGFNFAYRSASQPRPNTSMTPVSNSSSNSAQLAIAPSSPVTHQSVQFSGGRPPQVFSQSSNTKPSHPTSPTDQKISSFSRDPPSDPALVPNSAGSHNVGFNAPSQTHQQGSGYANQMSNGTRYSNHYSPQQHRYSKSRDDRREEGSRTHTPYSVSVSTGADANQAHGSKTNKIHKALTHSPGSVETKDANKSRSTPEESDVKAPYHVPSSPTVTKGHENPDRASPSGPIASSPAPSRKPSFVNKKKRSSGGAPTGSSKSDTERSAQDKTETEGVSATQVGNGPASLASTREPKDALARPHDELEPRTSEQSGKGSSTVPDTGSGAPNGGGGGQTHHRGRGGFKGRGTYSSKNNRGGRGGRGGDSNREGFNSRASGPGLVGPALAGAGIANKNGANNAPSSQKEG